MNNWDEVNKSNLLGKNIVPDIKPDPIYKNEAGPSVFQNETKPAYTENSDNISFLENSATKTIENSDDEQHPVPEIYEMTYEFETPSSENIEITLRLRLTVKQAIELEEKYSMSITDLKFKIAQSVTIAADVFYVLLQEENPEITYEYALTMMQDYINADGSFDGFTDELIDALETSGY